jgi:hypothetical protein
MLEKQALKGKMTPIGEIKHDERSNHKVEEVGEIRRQ